MQRYWLQYQNDSEFESESESESFEGVIDIFHVYFLFEMRYNTIKTFTWLRDYQQGVGTNMCRCYLRVPLDSFSTLKFTSRSLRCFKTKCVLKQLIVG